MRRAAFRYESSHPWVRTSLNDDVDTSRLWERDLLLFGFRLRTGRRLTSPLPLPRSAPRSSGAARCDRFPSFPFVVDHDRPEVARERLLQPQHRLRVELRDTRLGEPEHGADLLHGELLAVVEAHDELLALGQTRDGL